MQVRRIEIIKWRNFENIAFDIPQDANLVCLVGENGTGKSNLLELIAAAAHELGISQGLDTLRGDPFQTDHNVIVTFGVPSKPELFFGPDWTEIQAIAPGWGGAIVIHSANVGNTRRRDIIFPGTAVATSNAIHSRIRQALNRSGESHYLLLDANRAYPQVTITRHEYEEMIIRDWDAPEWRRNRTHLRTSQMYEDWIRSLIAKETQAGSRLLELHRINHKSGIPVQWTDPFDAYRTAVATVLPHLKFSRIDLPSKTLCFDSSGQPLVFHQLSGGEKEISFMIGQVFRFGLQHGLFLIDEPELHLNPDLLRTWITWLRSSIKQGQTWVATHSLEAVEAAEKDAVFILERRPLTPGDRVVRRISALGGGAHCAHPFRSAWSTGFLHIAIEICLDRRRTRGRRAPKVLISI